MLRLVPVLFAFVITHAVAAPGARQRLEDFSAGLKTISGQFEQSVTGANGNHGDASAGTFALEAPRQFRWETTSPFQQLIVADGKRVWIFDPDLEQVSVRPQGAEEAHSPLTVLTDLSQLDAEFEVSEAGEREGLAWLKLVSKAKEPEFAFAELGFDASGLARMRFEDSLGNTTEIRFSNWKRNPALSADTFHFTPPPGIDVVGDPGEEPEVFPLEN